MSAKGPIQQKEIVRRLATKIARRVLARTIRTCRGMKSHLSGPTSPLANMWEDICAQELQQKRLPTWEEAYGTTLMAILEAEIGMLEEAARWAIWYQTEAGLEWGTEAKSKSKEFSDEYLARFILNSYVLPTAKTYSNVRIRHFVESRKEMRN